MQNLTYKNYVKAVERTKHLLERRYNYTVGDTFVVDGTQLDGVTTTNDATISVATVDGDGKIPVCK